MGNINGMAHLLLWKGGLLAIKFCSYYIGTLVVGTTTETPEKPVTITITNNIGTTELRSHKEMEGLHENYRDEEEQLSSEDEEPKKEEKKPEIEREELSEINLNDEEEEEEENEEEKQVTRIEKKAVEVENKVVNVEEKSKEVVEVENKVAKIEKEIPNPAIIKVTTFTLHPTTDKKTQPVIIMAPNQTKMITGAPNVVVQKKKYVNL